MKTNPDFLNRKNVATYLAMSVRTLERLHRAGSGPPRTRVGGQWYYPRVELANWMEARTVRQNATERDTLGEVA